MALEPLMPGAVEDDSELRAVRRKFWIAASLSIPVVLIAMIPHLFDIHFADATARTLRFLAIALSAPVVLWAGASFYRRGWNGVLNRSANMYTLIGLGVFVAYAFSLFATFPPRCFRRRCAIRMATWVYASKSPLRSLRWSCSANGWN